MKTAFRIHVPPLFAALLILAAALSLAAVPAAARTTGWEPYGETWYDVSLVTTTGHSLGHVKVQWLTNGSRLRVTRKGGAYRDYEPEEIRELRTADGLDITGTVASARPGGAHRDDEHVNLGRNREPKLFSQSFDIGFGYAMVMGEWFGDWSYGFLADMDEGLNVHTGFRAGLSGRTYLRLMYRHQLGNIEPVFGGVDTVWTQQGGTPVVDKVDTLWVDLNGSVDELTLSLGVSLTGTERGGKFAVAELGGGLISRRITGPDKDERVTEPVLQVGLLSMLPLDDSSAIELGASLSVKPTGFGNEGHGGALMRAYVGYSFVGW